MIPGDKVDKDFIIGTLRVSLEALIIILLTLFIFSQISPFMFTPWGAPAFVVLTLVLWLCVFICVFLLVSLSSLFHVLAWSKDNIHSILSTVLMNLSVWTFIGFGVQIGTIGSDKHPFILFTSLTAMSILISFSAAKLARKIYYNSVVNKDGEDQYFKEDDNWAESSLKAAAKVILPRATGDYSRFKFAPLLFLISTVFIIVCATFFSILVLVVPTQESFGFAATGLVLAPICFWVFVGFAGRYISERRRYDPNTLSLRPGV